MYILSIKPKKGKLIFKPLVLFCKSWPVTVVHGTWQCHWVFCSVL